MCINYEFKYSRITAKQNFTLEKFYEFEKVIYFMKYWMKKKILLINKHHRDLFWISVAFIYIKEIIF